MLVFQRQKLVFAAAMVFLLNALDLISTYLISPDLTGEWNILHRYYDLGWAGLIVAKFIGGALAVYGYAFYLRHRTACYPSPGASLSEFHRHLAFGGRQESLRAFLTVAWWRHLGVNLGYFWAGMQVILVWVAMDNILLGFGIVNGMRYHSEMGYHLYQGIVISLLNHIWFSLSNYRRYRLLTEGGAIVAPLGRASARASLRETV